MKVQSRNNTAATNVENRFNFTIADNHQMFDLIMNKLYTNKVGAVLRELGANAVDSHIEAGHKKPFDIHLPTNLEPYFYIRDYGTGLTPQEIRELYTCLGASSKRYTNDAIGSFGIGSKSPFAYTESFTIISYKDGLRHSYQAFLGKERKPEVAIFEEKTKTDEPNGLKIQLACDRHDFGKFINELSQYDYFIIPPNVVNYNYKQPEQEYSVKTKRYGLKNKVKTAYNYHYDGNINAIMGGIKYKYTPQNISWLEKYDIDLFFDIGEISIAGNREEVEYDKFTLDAIKNIFQEIEKSIEKEILAAVNSAKNYYEACKIYKNTPLASKFKIKYNGKELCEKACLVTNINHSYRHPSACDISLNIRGSFSQFRPYGSRLKDYANIHFENDVFVINDLTAGSIGRCQNIRHQSPILFDLEDGDLDIIKKTLDIDDSYFTMASSLAKPTRSSNSRKSVKGGLYKISPLERKIYDKLTEVPKIPKGSYYVELNRQQPVWNGKIYSFENISDVMSLLSVNDVYGINKSRLTKKLKKPLKCLFEEFNNFKSDVDYNLVVDKPTLTDKKLVNVLKNIKTDCDTIKEYIKYFDELSKSHSLNDRRYKIRNLSYKLNIINGKEKVIKKQDFSTKINNMYPLAYTAINTSYGLSDKEAKHIEQYINCIGD